MIEDEFDIQRILLQRVYYINKRDNQLLTIKQSIFFYFEQNKHSDKRSISKEFP